MPKIANHTSSPAIKSYIAVFSARFRTLLQYRAAAFAGFGTQFFWGLIRVMIFEAFYRSTTAPQPMTADEVITYIWLGQAFLVLIPYQGADPDIRAMVRSGNVVYELVRPTNLYFFWYSRAIAQRTAPGVFRALPMFIMAGLFFNMQMPPNIPTACAWLVSMLFAVLISAAITNLLNISLLWTISGEGLGLLLSSLTWLFSGIIIPLLFFPDWAQATLNILPFRYILDIPFRFYLSHIPPEEIWYHLPFQITYLIALITAGHLILTLGIRRLVAQGG